MADEIATPEQLDAYEARIDAWLVEQLHENPAVVGIERGGPDERRWIVRLRGEEKELFAVWFTLDQRTLQYETYVMPAPIENHAACYEHLLRRNEKLFGVAFAIGAEDAVFLTGQIPVHTIDEGELDRILGTLWATTEQCFRPAMRVGFASVFRG
ncbi:MAG: YbjN domain-containing protein [Acidimicrobiales bacterium]